MALEHRVVDILQKRSLVQQVEVLANKRGAPLMMVVPKLLVSEQMSDVMGEARNVEFITQETALTV